MVKSYGWVVGGGPGHYAVISWDWGYTLFPIPISIFPIPIPIYHPQSKSPTPISNPSPQSKAQAQSQLLDNIYKILFNKDNPKRIVTVKDHIIEQGTILYNRL